MSQLLQLDPSTYKQAEACVHCGLCLPACPTYSTNGNEADSPRGRIYLMKAMADGRIAPSEEVVGHLDLCLDCRACETACPSGVVYHELIEESRAQLLKHNKKSFGRKLVEWHFLNVFPDPMALRLMLFPVRIMQKLGLWSVMSKMAEPVLPAEMRKMQSMLPDGPIWSPELDVFYPALGKAKKQVGLLAGCVGSVLGHETNVKAIRLLQLAGCDVHVPASQGCCGALHAHSGHMEEAEQYAVKNLSAFAEMDAVVTPIAGCGAMLKDTGHMLRHGDHAEKAAGFSDKVRDICELLYELGLPEPEHEVAMKATYHDACHLAHAQRVVNEPRELLQCVKGLELSLLPESMMCCGAAGTYNLTQPEMSQDLGDRKFKHIQSTGAEVCITGNIGCAMQIASVAEKNGHSLEVLHPVDVLSRAYFGE